VQVTSINGTVLAKYGYDALGERITQADSGGPTTDLYYSDQWQVLQEQQGALVTDQEVWSPFDVDKLVERDSNPDVTANQSNGSVDTSFGTSTTASTTTTTLSSNPTSAMAIADGPDTLVAALVGGTPELLWYTSTGSLDTANYGSGTGIVTLSSWTNWTSINGLVIQANGDIDIAAQTTSGGLNVAQLNASGTAVSSFGTSGLETLSSLPGAQGLVIGANGDLLVGGISSFAFVVAALNCSTGSPDTGFNTSGSASVNIFATSGFSFSGMAAAPNGDVIIAGNYRRVIISGGHSTTTTYVALAELTPAGHTDAAFGASGLAQFNVGSGILITGTVGRSPLAVNADGQIFLGTVAVIGEEGEETSSLSVIEYNRNGTLDTSFGTGGTATAGAANVSTGVILDIEANGQIVVGAGGNSGSFTLARFNANGSSDTTFGSGGVASGAMETAGLAMTITSSGETVIVGTPSSGTGIILQQFHTQSGPQRLYAETDADDNVTSLTNISGTVVERYVYDPYGTVTVENADGSVRGDGSAASSFYGWVYLHQGLRLDVTDGLYDNRARVYSASLGNFVQEDPLGYAGGADRYCYEDGCTIDGSDPSGMLPEDHGHDDVGVITNGSDKGARVFPEIDPATGKPNGEYVYNNPRDNQWERAPRSDVQLDKNVEKPAQPNAAAAPAQNPPAEIPGIIKVITIPDAAGGLVTGAAANGAAQVATTICVDPIFIIVKTGNKLARAAGAKPNNIDQLPWQANGIVQGGFNEYYKFLWKELAGE
jgi:RHS repeat-associated protein/uncharacterized delta-60 repeat protein